MNPGGHRIEATLSAKQKAAAVQLVPGQEAVVELDFSPPAKAQTAGSGSAKPTSTRRTLGWVGVGAGGVGLALGSVMGALALNKHASIKDSGVCSGSQCPAAAQSDVNRLNLFRTVSTVGFIAGGALAVTGVVLVLTAPSSEPQLAAMVSGDGVTLAGRF